MAYKRLVAVVPVLEGKVVMSYGYTRHNPAGNLKTTLRNLDRWGVDEIVVIDISMGLDAPDFSLLGQIRHAAIRTPVAFGGGIRKAAEAVKAISLGCDRVVVETLIWDAPAEISAISSAVGQQAIIGAIPVVHSQGQLWAAPVRHAREALQICMRRIQDLQVSELLVIDREHEGTQGSHAVAGHIDVTVLPQKVIWFGGLDTVQAARCLQRLDTVGVAFGNPFMIQELAVHQHRQSIRTIAGAGALRKVTPYAEV